MKANVAEKVLEFCTLVWTDMRRAMVVPAALKMGERLLKSVAERYLRCESEIPKEWDRICLSVVSNAVMKLLRPFNVDQHSHIHK